MSGKNLIVAIDDPNLASMLEKSVLRPASYEVRVAADQETLNGLIETSMPDLVLIGEQLRDCTGLELAGILSEKFPHISMILMANTHSEALLHAAMRKGFADYIAPPATPKDIIASIERTLNRHNNLQEWAASETTRKTTKLRSRLEELEALQQVGQVVNSSLNLDGVLSTVVDTAVDLTNADESSLLLFDESSGDLYMRAARNFQDDFVRTFRLPVKDSLAGQVLRTGKPLIINENTPQKIKTAYLVQNLIYVPLLSRGRIIGVLGVDNRNKRQAFTQAQVTLLTSLADHAAIAIENAKLYSSIDGERKQLETILAEVEEGMIVVDRDHRLLICNQTARLAFNIEEKNLVGKHIKDVFHHPDLLEIFEQPIDQPTRTEITLDNGQIVNAQITPIRGIGVAITMQDISHLKELDRIKTDFVSTLSHDLRSPLTSILGYVELIERIGPITAQQQEFVGHIKQSVSSITALINDLLDLGRVETGFDSHNEVIPIPELVNDTIENLHTRTMEKSLQIVLDVPVGLPSILGNPIRMRQVLGNLVTNAIKYTPRQGKITIRARAEEGQAILQVIDNGIGIPISDQPFVFNKFYRATNIPHDSQGTGLGLAIVKSIVEQHQGRIWLDSTPGMGSTFTIVLPINDQSL